MSVAELVLGIAGLLLVVLGQTAAVIGWYLKRERGHEQEDRRMHEGIAKDFTQVRSDHAKLAGDVQALDSRVDGMPSRDLMEDHMRRLRDEIRSDLQPLQNQLAQLIDLQLRPASPLRNRRSTDGQD
jgi:hypothetical protein